MRLPRVDWIAVGCSLIAVPFWAAAVVNCGAAPTPAQQVDMSFWTALDTKCVAQSSSRAEADKCADVQRIAACGPGGALADAGPACADVRLSDGGRPQ